MRWMRGDMLSNIPVGALVFITTNAYIRRDGCLVMGRGAAAQAARLWTELPKLAGNVVTHMKRYGCRFVCGIHDDIHLGIFQVKYHFKDQADLSLIEWSCQDLREKALANPERTVRLNFPGIGWGGRTVGAVKPILEKYFSDVPNVEVWTF